MSGCRTGLTAQIRLGVPIFRRKSNAISREIPRGAWVGIRDFPGNFAGDSLRGRPDYPGLRRALSRWSFPGNPAGRPGNSPRNGSQKRIRRFSRDTRTGRPGDADRSPVNSPGRRRFPGIPPGYFSPGNAIAGKCCSPENPRDMEAMGFPGKSGWEGREMLIISRGIYWGGASFPGEFPDGPPNLLAGGGAGRLGPLCRAVRFPPNPDSKPPIRSS